MEVSFVFSFFLYCFVLGTNGEELPHAFNEDLIPVLLKGMGVLQSRIRQMERRVLETRHREIAMLQRIQHLEVKLSRTERENEEMIKFKESMQTENPDLQENLSKQQKETRRIIPFLTTFSSRKPSSTFTEIPSNNKSLETQGIYHKSRVPILRRQSKSSTRISSKRAANAVVAFSAYLTSYVSNLGLNQVIKYDGILTNEGNAYNPLTGIFTCPEDGLYLMAFFICSVQHQVWVALMVDDVIVSNAVYAPAVEVEKWQEGQSGNVAILRLRTGQSVWLSIPKKNGEDLLASTPLFRHVTFSGVRFSH